MRRKSFFSIYLRICLVLVPTAILADDAFNNSLAGKASYNFGIVLGAFIFPFIALTALTWKKDRRYSSGGRGVSLILRVVVSALAAAGILYWYYNIRT